MDKIKINLFGIGCTIVHGSFDNDTWERFTIAAKQIETPLIEAFFDPSFFTQLKDFKSWKEIGNQHRLSGLLEHYQSVVEIRINGKQKRRIAFNDLTGREVLFPLYLTSLDTIEFSQSHERSITLVEKEVGSFASYQMDLENFSLDKLQFNLQRVQTSEIAYLIISDLIYDNQKLTLRRKDTVIRERFALID